MSLREKRGRHITQVPHGQSASGTAGPVATKLSELGTRGRLLPVGVGAPTQAASRQGDTTGCHSEWWGLCWRQGHPQSRGTMWWLRKDDWDLCHLWCRGAGPSPAGMCPLQTLEQRALLGELPQGLETASHFPLIQVYQTSHSCPGFMGEPTGQPKCLRKSRELERVPSTRNRAGLWGSVTSPS